jgi:N-acetylglutamate synthase-like GNAT family acetyltransferase
MAIEYSENLPSIAKYKELFASTGWNKIISVSPDELYKALQQSWCVECAYDSSRLVGFGRVVSDGVLYAMIYDLIVAPSYQRTGIGSEILYRLINMCREAGIRELQLFSAAGLTEFYQKRGFEQRPTDAPGMRLKK